jgi:hypothetical protein
MPTKSQKEMRWQLVLPVFDNAVFIFVREIVSEYSSVDDQGESPLKSIIKVQSLPARLLS